MKAVVFDLGGVVFHYTPEIRWQKFAEVTGEDPDLIRRRMQDSGYAQACDRGRLNREGAYREGVKLLGHRLSALRFTAIWISVFTPDEAVIDIVHALKNHYAVALLSNNSALAHHGLESAYPHVLELFRPRLFSADLGLMKPDPRAFAAALEMLNTTGPETLLIDDSSANTTTASSLGIVTHQFAGAQGLRSALSQLGMV
jgi:HAD superfamily hydrolase (TIGR01509 family)